MGSRSSAFAGTRSSREPGLRLVDVHTWAGVAWGGEEGCRGLEVGSRIAQRPPGTSSRSHAPPDRPRDAQSFQPLGVSLFGAEPRAPNVSKAQPLGKRSSHHRCKLPRHRPDVRCMCVLCAFDAQFRMRTCVCGILSHVASLRLRGRVTGPLGLGGDPPSLASLRLPHAPVDLRRLQLLDRRP